MSCSSRFKFAEAVLKVIVCTISNKLWKFSTGAHDSLVTVGLSPRTVRLSLCSGERVNRVDGGHPGKIEPARRMARSMKSWYFHRSYIYNVRNSRFILQPDGQSDIVWCYTGLENYERIASKVSIPKDPTFRHLSWGLMKALNTRHLNSQLHKLRASSRVYNEPPYKEILVFRAQM